MWIPSLFLGAVLLVLILQLPWRKPKSRADSLVKKADLGIGERLPGSDSTSAKDAKGHSAAR